MTEKQARRAIRVMVDRGIIEVGKWQFNGAPTAHIRLNWHVFLKALEEATAVAKEKVVSQLRPAQKAKRSAQKSGSLTETTSKTTTEINSEVDFGNEVDDDDDESRQHDSLSSVPTKQK